MAGQQSPAVSKKKMCYLVLSQVPDGSGNYPDLIDGPIPIPKVPYRVYTDFLLTDEVAVPGAPATGPESDNDGVVVIPWAPKPDASTPTDLYMVLEMFDSVYRITLLPALTPLDPAKPPEVSVLQRDRKQSPAPAPDLTIKAIQERLDILGYLRCFGDNEGALPYKSFLDGINDEVTEEGILNFQHDRALRVHGMPDTATLTSLESIIKRKGYG